MFNIISHPPLLFQTSLLPIPNLPHPNSFRKQVEDQCPVSRGTRRGLRRSGGATLLSTKAEKEQERCLAEEPAQAGVNSALLKIFSSPGVMEAAEKELDASSAHSLKDLVKNVERAEAEEIHPVGCFSFFL